jgi:hypothetical protein
MDHKTLFPVLEMGFVFELYLTYLESVDFACILNVSVNR